MIDKKVCIIAVGLVMLVTSSCTTYMNEVQYLKNTQLATIKSDYPGNFFSHGKFSGKYTSEGAESLFNFIKWKLSSNPKKAIKEKETFVMPVIKHDSLPQLEQPYLMWLGHSTVLLRINGNTILTDPVLTSPRYLHSERLTEVPIDMKKVIIDSLLVSHGHRDHLDEETIGALKGRSIQAYIPLKMGELIQGWNTNLKIEEAGWYQKFTSRDSIDIYFLPAYHWYRRSMLDLNTVLWGSYLIQFNGIKIYFAGDSGYSSHFKEIGQQFGNIDIAILPIGSYDPSFMMKNNHMNPEEAIQAFHDLNAKILVPVHYGTFDQTDEPMAEPIQRLIKQIEADIIKKEEVKILKLGEIFPL